MIKKIILTGGPCAGKTTVLKAIKNNYTEKGFKVVCVPETATEFIDNGIDFDTYKNAPTFQNFIFKKQLIKEDLYLDAAKASPFYDKILVIYDRGIFDNIAYLDTHKDFDEIVSKNNINEIQKLDKYDLVLNLITTADCNPSVYKTNKTRKETPEEAIALDRKTTTAWVGHRNIKIINTSTSLNEEIKTAKKYIDQLINNEQIKEIETLELNPKKTDISKYNDNNSRMIKKTNIYLEAKDKNIDYIISTREYKNKMSYTFTISESNNGITTTYYDKQLSNDETLKKISNSRIKNIEKEVEISFAKEKQLYSLIIKNNKMYLNFERNKLNEKFVIPDGIILKNDYNIDKIYQKVLKYDKII